MICKRCGKSLDDDRVDCPYCGSPLFKENNNEKSLSGGYSVAMYLFSVLGGFLGFFLSINVLFAKGMSGLKKYNQEARKTATITLVISLLSL